MKPALIVVLLTLPLMACSSTLKPITERPGEVTLRGNPVTLVGEPVEVGDTAPDFVAVKQDMKEAKLSDYAGKAIVLSVVPSVDKNVCAIQTKAFNEKAAALGEDVVILTISMDLPMAQKRFCAAEGIDQVITLSDYRYWDFGKTYGQRIKENGLLARAIYIINPEGVITHKEIVPELTDEPDYDAALNAIKS
ncbi:MAG: thiol peroxidase [Planctomycetota bacterium]